MALPINKSPSGKWQRRKDREAREDMLSDSEPEESEALQRVKSWKMTDQLDNPTRRGAWSLFEDSIKESYAKPTRQMSYNADLNSTMVANQPRQRSRNSAYYSQFNMLEDDFDSVPRYRREHNAADDYRPLARQRSQRQVKHYEPRYDTSAPVDSNSEAEDDEQIWSAPALPIRERLKKYSRDRPQRIERDEHIYPRHKSKYYEAENDYEFSTPTGPSDGYSGEPMPRATKPYYSRRTFGDPDYYDSDLTSEVLKFKELFKTAHGDCNVSTGALGPNAFEQKVLSQANKNPEAAISSYLFTKTGGFDKPDRAMGVSLSSGIASQYLGATMRTPGYWTKRFDDICTSVRSEPRPLPQQAQSSRYMSDEYDSDC